MKKYLLPLISFIIVLICGVAYNIIGCKVAPDGTLVEAFFLIPLAWLFLFISIISTLIIFIHNRIVKYKKSSNH